MVTELSFSSVSFEISIGISPALFVNPIRFNPFETVSLPAGVPSSISTAGATAIIIKGKKSFSKAIKAGEIRSVFSISK